MIQDLRPASTREHLVFFDPQAIPAEAEVDPDLEAQHPELPSPDTIRGLTTHGQALVLKIPGEDCEAAVRLFVDEAMPESLQKHGKRRLEGALLQLPSGTLRADGLEFLTRPGEERLHSEAERVPLEPGPYEVELWDFFHIKTQHAESFVKAQTSATQRLMSRLINLYAWLGLVLIPANLLLFPMAILWSADRGDWKTALLALGILLGVDVLVFSGFHLLEWANRKFPALNRANELRRQFHAEFPDLALLLRSAAPQEALGTPARVELPWDA